MTKIKILSMQFAPKKADKAFNLERVKKIIAEHGNQEYDLIVLPEFFDAGVNLSNKEFYEFAEDEKKSVVLKELAKVATNYNSYVHCGGVLFKEKGKCFNRTYLLDRNGEIAAKYDKIHLFSYFGGNEDSYTYPGDKIKVYEADFGKIGLAICFDLRYPQHFTNLVRQGAELFVVPAAWSVVKKATIEYKEQFIENWRTINKARAFDNAAFLVSANNAGDMHPMFNGIGHSMMVDFDGKILAEADEKSDKFIYSELDFGALRKYRERFPIGDLC